LGLVACFIVPGICGVCYSEEVGYASVIPILQRGGEFGNSRRRKIADQASMGAYAFGQGDGG
jgi:hypothetical protein